jgi:autotransporter-associated beta strand protein
MKTRHSFLLNLRNFLVACCMAFAISQAQGAIQYWDVNGTTTGSGGPSPNGVWDTTTANWGNSLGTAAPGVWVQGNTALFSAGSPAPGDATGSYTITVGDATTVRNIRMYSGTPTSSTIAFTGGNITMIGGIAGSFYIHSTGPKYVDVYSKVSSDALGSVSFSRAVATQFPVVTFYNSANDFSGAVNIRSTGLTFKMGAAGVIPTGVTSLGSAGGGGILDLNGFSTAFDTVSGNVVINNLNAGQSFTFRNPAGESYSGAVSGNGDLIKNGAGAMTMSGASSGFNGNLKINQGTLTLSGTLGSSATIDLDGGALAVSTYTLGAGQTLKGGGNITGSINGNGTITPGHSIGAQIVSGTLTLGSTANLQMEIDRNDGVTFLGDKITATSIVEGGTLNILNIGGTLQLGDSFDLFDGTLSSAFANIYAPNVPGLGVEGVDWHWDYAGLAPGGDGTIMLVPEPSSLALSILGGLGLLWSIRRRKV